MTVYEALKIGIQMFLKSYNRRAYRTETLIRIEARLIVWKVVHGTSVKDAAISESEKDMLTGPK